MRKILCLLLACTALLLAGSAVVLSILTEKLSSSPLPAMLLPFVLPLGTSPPGVKLLDVSNGSSDEQAVVTAIDAVSITK